MKNFELDFSLLEDNVVPKKIEKLSVKENKHRMIKVAFDMFRLDGDKKEELWQVQADDDGNEFLVRTYSLSEEDEKLITASNWNVFLNKNGSNLTIAYKSVPITNVSLSLFGVTAREDVDLIQKTVVKKFACDCEFLKSFVESLPQEKQSIINDLNKEETPYKSEMDLPLSFPDKFVFIMDEKGGLSEEKAEEDEKDEKDELYKDNSERIKDSDSKKEEENDSSSGWWESLSDKERDDIFHKFEKVEKITKEQAWKLLKLEKMLVKNS